MPTNRRYTDEFRASAVLMLEAAGWPEQKGALSRVARQLEVSHQTLGRWARGIHNPPPSDIVQEKRESLIDMMDKMLVEILQHMHAAIPDASFSQLATGYGILFDKRQLSIGGATQNIEQRVATVVKWDDDTD